MNAVLTLSFAPAAVLADPKSPPSARTRALRKALARPVRLARVRARHSRRPLVSLDLGGAVQAGHFFMVFALSLEKFLEARAETLTGHGWGFRRHCL